MCVRVTLTGVLSKALRWLRSSPADVDPVYTGAESRPPVPAGLDLVGLGALRTKGRGAPTESLLTPAQAGNLIRLRMPQRWIVKPRRRRVVRLWGNPEAFAR
jgi:hypothetical protein